MRNRRTQLEDKGDLEDMLSTLIYHQSLPVSTPLLPCLIVSLKFSSLSYLLCHLQDSIHIFLLESPQLTVFLSASFLSFSQSPSLLQFSLLPVFKLSQSSLHVPLVSLDSHFSPVSWSPVFPSVINIPVSQYNYIPHLPASSLSQSPLPPYVPDFPAGSVDNFLGVGGASRKIFSNHAHFCMTTPPIFYLC